MMDVQAAFKMWTAANADLARLQEKTLISSDIPDNLACWLSGIKQHPRQTQRLIEGSRCALSGRIAH